MHKACAQIFQATVASTLLFPADAQRVCSQCWLLLLRLLLLQCSGPSNLQRSCGCSWLLLLFVLLLLPLLQSFLAVNHFRLSAAAATRLLQTFGNIFLSNLQTAIVLLYSAAAH